LPAEPSAIAATVITETVEPIGGGDPGDAPEYPTSAGSGGDFAEDVRWAYENYSRVVIQAPGKPARCDFSRATSPPPSGGAVGLLVWVLNGLPRFSPFAILASFQ